MSFNYGRNNRLGKIKNKNQGKRKHLSSPSYLDAVDIFNYDMARE